MDRASHRVAPPAALAVGSGVTHSWQLLWVVGVVCGLPWGLLLAALRDTPTAVVAAAATCSGLLYIGVVRLVAWVRGETRHVLLTGLLVTLAVFGLVARVAALPFLNMLDAALGGFAIVMAFGRLGCRLSGCCAGTLVHFGASPDDSVRFPNQLVEAGAWLVLGLSVLPMILALGPGEPSGLVMIAYAVLRTWLEGLRADYRPHFLGISQARWFCLPVGITGIALTTPELSPGGWAAALAGLAAAGVLLLMRGRLFPAILHLPDGALEDWVRTVDKTPPGTPPPPLMRPGLLLDLEPHREGGRLRVRTAGGVVFPAIVGALARRVRAARGAAGALTTHARSATPLARSSTESGQSTVSASPGDRDENSPVAAPPLASELDPQEPVLRAP